MDHTSLNDLKRKFFIESSLLKSNRFSVSMSLKNPATSSSFTATDVPVVSASAPTIDLDTVPFEFQGIPLNLPYKRNSTQDLLITFYADKNLSFYNEMQYIIKQYGGGQYGATRPTAFIPESFYNECIRPNFVVVHFITDGLPSGAYGSPTYADGAVNYITYQQAFPYNILPIEVNSRAESEFLTFGVLFKYAYTRTRYDAIIGN